MTLHCCTSLSTSDFNDVIQAAHICCGDSIRTMKGRKCHNSGLWGLCSCFRFFSAFDTLQSVAAYRERRPISACVRVRLFLLCPLFPTLWTVAHWLLCLWDSPGKNAGVGCHLLLQGIFPTQGLNLCLLKLLHCRRILNHWAINPLVILLDSFPPTISLGFSFLMYKKGNNKRNSCMGL